MISDNSGIKRSAVKSIRFEDRDVNSAKKGQDVGVDFGVKVGNGVDVYKIKKVK